MTKAQQFDKDKVHNALSQMGIASKDITDDCKILGFLDDQEQCRKFCTFLQGTDATKRTDPTFMSRYQARAERVIRNFAGMEIPSDLDVNNERYKTMAKSTAKVKTLAKGKTKTKVKKAKAPKAKVSKSKAPKLALVNKGEPDWFSKFSRRGIAFRMAVLMHRKSGRLIAGEEKKSDVTGASKKEILADLVRKFPERDADSMSNNVNIEVSALQRRLGKKVERIEDEKRGLVYSFPA